MREYSSTGALIAGVTCCVIAACSAGADGAGNHYAPEPGSGGEGNVGPQPSGGSGGDKDGIKPSVDAYNASLPGRGSGGAGGASALEFEPPLACEGTAFNAIATMGFRPASSQSNGSAVLASALLSSSTAPPAFSVRPQDFVWQYVRPAPTNQIQLVSDLLIDDVSGEWIIQVTVQAPTVEEHRATAVTFAVDTSPSMEGSPIALSKAVLSAIASQLEDGDDVSIVTGTGVTYTGDGNSTELESAIAELATETDADMGTLIKSAVARASAHSGAPGGSYVVLLTDGNESLPGDAIKEFSGFSGGGSLRFIGVGVGEPALYQPGLLHQLSSATSGQRYFVPSDVEAVASFGADRFSEVFGTFGSDPRIEFELPDYVDLVDEPEIVELPGEASGSRRWAPGEMLLVRQALVACAPGVQKAITEYQDTQPQNDLLTGIGINVRYNDDQGLEQTHVGSVSVLPDLGAVSAENQRLGRVRAALLLADALGAPTWDRLQDADQEFIVMEAAGINLGTMPMLLRKHPAYATP